MSDTNGNIAYRIAECERVNAFQQAKIEEAQKTLAEIAGAQKERQQAENKSGRLIGPAIAVGFALISGFVSYSVLGNIEKLSSRVSDVSLAAATREERVTNLEARKSPDLSIITNDLAEIRTKLSTIEQTQASMLSSDAKRESDISTIRQALSSSEASMASVSGSVDENSRDISRLEATAAQNQKNIQAVDSKSSAGFVEVESQLRGIIATLQVRFDQSDGIMGLTYEKVFGVKAPETKAFPSEIPAKAFTTIGGAATGN